MIALKMTADRMADVGECRFITSNAFSHGKVPANSAGTMAKYLATSLAIEKVVECPAGHQQLLANLDDLDQLGRVAVEIDHVAGFFGSLGAGIHRDAHIGLSERRRIVGAVSHHGDEFALGLLLADIGELGFGRGLGQEIVHARGLGNGRRGERIVARDHHGPQAHLPQPLKAVFHARLQDVLQDGNAGDAGFPRTPIAALRRSWPRFPLASSNCGGPCRARASHN